MIKKKVLAIIKSEQENFLLLRTNPKHMKIDSWYVVTGGVEANETDDQAVRREIKEETNLEIINVSPTGLVLTYDWPKGSGQMCEEKVFMVLAKEGPVKLSKWEHLESKWLSKEDFIDQIDWFGPKSTLTTLLK